MVFKFFDTTAVDAFAVKMARELVKHAPPSGGAQDARKAAKKRSELDARIAKQVQLFVQTTPLNFYQKAKVGMRLQDELDAAGYDPEVSKALSYEVAKLVALARRSTDA